jgi:hypothetical protein
MRDAMGAHVRVLTEEELAGWWLEQGRRIIRHRGRFWLDRHGFCRLLHFAATIPADLVSRPSRACWAYHALLSEADTQHANRYTPLHLVRGLSEFDERRLDASARKRLRRCRASMQLIRVDDPELLRAQGWGVFLQNARRLGMYRRVTKERFMVGAENLATDSRRLILGAMDGERLLGYLETFAVEDTAYLAEIRLSDEAMSRHVSGFLHFEASQLYRHDGRVHQVCSGPPLPERAGVSEFKRRWGMPIVHIPTLFWAPSPAQALLKLAAPAAYYRATGLPARGISPVGSDSKL